VYWRPVWRVLEALDDVELLLCNAHHVKNLPGRKTDVGDAAWLAQLLECGLLRGSFVPPPVIARARDLTRYRKKMVQERARETQRVQKQLELAGIKLDSVVSDVLGVSSRRMLEALLAGDQDLDEMADMALGRMRSKIEDLKLALEPGDFDTHRKLMIRMHLDHIDHLSGVIDRLDEEVQQALGPFSAQLALLQTMTGIAQRSSEMILAEIGVDMSRFPTAQHLASWAGLCPGNNESAGKRRTGKARKGNATLRATMCEVAWCAARSRDSYLAAQFRRFRRRFGTNGENKAIFVVAHTMLVAIWHMLHDNVTYSDLGADYFDRRRDDSAAHTRRLVRQLEALGHRVILDPAA
jgi:transposase